MQMKQAVSSARDGCPRPTGFQMGVLDILSDYVLIFQL
jgi:hypothetical protein